MNESSQGGLGYDGDGGCLKSQARGEWMACGDRDGDGGHYAFPASYAQGRDRDRDAAHVVLGRTIHRMPTIESLGSHEVMSLASRGGFSRTSTRSNTLSTADAPRGRKLTNTPSPSISYKRKPRAPGRAPSAARAARGGAAQEEKRRAEVARGGGTHSAPPQDAGLCGPRAPVRRRRTSKRRGIWHSAAALSARRRARRARGAS